MSYGSGLPGAVALRLNGRRSRAIFSWSAEDLSLTPRVGPTLALTRAGANGGLVRDAWGRGRFPNHSAPRFSMFDLDGDGFCETPALLLEPASTNKILRSQEFDNASWTKSRSSITANALRAPDGTLTADKLVEDSTASNTHHAQQSLTLAAAGNRWAVSCFVRADTRTQVALRGIDTGSNHFTCVYDLVALTATTSTGGTGTVVRGYLERWADDLGVAWYRCVVIGTSGSATASSVALVALASGGTISYSGDGASGLYIWGFQAEETENGATSYLPTVGSTVTRTTEALTATWPLLPGPLTLYADLIEVGQGLEYVSSKRVVQIGDGTTRSALLQSGSVTAIHDAGATSLSSAGTITGLGQGDQLELCAAIDPTGSATASYARNRGSSVAAAATAALAFATAYGGSPVKLAIGSQEGTSSFGAFAVRAVRIAAAARTLEQMRGMR